MYAAWLLTFLKDYAYGVSTPPLLFSHQAALIGEDDSWENDVTSRQSSAAEAHNDPELELSRDSSNNNSSNNDSFYRILCCLPFVGEGYNQIDD